MAQPFFNNSFEDEEYNIPLEYKIVDLPIIPLPQISIISSFGCKIYKKVSFPAVNPGEDLYEWKRKCHGNLKFIEKEGKIFVVAHEYGSCHNRLTEKPIQHNLFFNLQPSQEFENNWVYTDQNHDEISLAIPQQDFFVFEKRWEEARENNSIKEESLWIMQIGTDLFI